MDSRTHGLMPATGSASQGARPGPVTPLSAAADPPGEDGRELVGRLADAAEIALALPTLSRPQRQAIELAYFGRPSQREIAEHLQVPAGTIKARAERADHPAAMVALADARRDDLAGLSGYVVKSRSPSCGPRSARVYDGEARAAGYGTRVFAANVLAADPQLPAEEEGRLHDLPLREAFAERVFGRPRLTGLFAGPGRQRDLVELHSRHKLQLLAHDPVRYRQAGRLAATARALPAGTVSMRYAGLLASALGRPVSRGRHANALQHACCGARYLAAQTYLDPFPAALGLRNHA